MNFSNLNVQMKIPRIRYGSRIHPVRDWVALIVVGLVLLAALVVWAVLVYTGGAVVRVNEVMMPAPKALSPGLLQETDELFQARALEEERYRSEYEFVDPSLLAR